jgi:hypothetical protein
MKSHKIEILRITGVGNYSVTAMDSTAHKGNLAENSGGEGAQMALVIRNLDLRRNQVRKRENISLNQSLTL